LGTVVLRVPLASTGAQAIQIPPNVTIAHQDGIKARKSKRPVYRVYLGRLALLTVHTIVACAWQGRKAQAQRRYYARIVYPERHRLDLPFAMLVRLASSWQQMLGTMRKHANRARQGIRAFTARLNVMNVCRENTPIKAQRRQFANCASLAGTARQI
jgi:hypothetical protein